jgi:dsRNA-specific ribonuclease
MGKGEGHTKKEAEQHAAAEAIKRANLEFPGEPRHQNKKLT